MPDPFDAAGIRERVLAGWAAAPVRLREDANAEEDLALGGYRDRRVVELAQNAADAAARAERWGAAVLAAIGVLDGLGLLRLLDVHLDDPSDQLGELDGWAEWVESVGGSGGGVAELLAVRDLDLVRADRWPEVVRHLAATPALRRALVEQVQVVAADGSRRHAASYTAWWLRDALGLAGALDPSLTGDPDVDAGAPDAVRALVADAGQSEGRPGLGGCGRPGHIVRRRGRPAGGRAGAAARQRFCGRGAGHPVGGARRPARRRRAGRLVGGRRRAACGHQRGSRSGARVGGRCVAPAARAGGAADRPGRRGTADARGRCRLGAG
jgi:hypothetical protein